MYVEFFLLLCLLAVACNPSPYYAALGMVSGAGVGCLLLAKNGVTFLSLVLFLVYLGGMLVVFAYCSALVAEPYPEAWGSYEVAVYFLVYGGPLVGLMVVKKYGVSVEGGYKFGDVQEWWGVGDIMNSGGSMMFFGGWSLLLALFVVFEVVRGQTSGALRAV
ncbi:NADH dehydrogenase subunit 6 (mitochondrion) [Pyxicephalus adspersus]|uniref:NADH-ubiquinone oxidoreductase chain 6 n=1 Tax=Pyxicephalus adspersus TaxID=30357 RepID=A0A5B8GV52_PYXAD|nr:NADH dehydrogenase subunit 6 [Pyxicephalus adspersus]QDW76108.1 NADH dehydrogenase subunit 6 [Pyxicephalus adspersus]